MLAAAEAYNKGTASLYKTKEQELEFQKTNELIEGYKASRNLGLDKFGLQKEQFGLDKEQLDFERQKFLFDQKQKQGYLGVQQAQQELARDKFLTEQINRIPVPGYPGKTMPVQDYTRIITPRSGTTHKDTFISVDQATKFSESLLSELKEYDSLEVDNQSLVEKALANIIKTTPTTKLKRAFLLREARKLINKVRGRVNAPPEKGDIPTDYKSLFGFTSKPSYDKSMPVPPSIQSQAQTTTGWKKIPSKGNLTPQQTTEAIMKAKGARKDFVRDPKTKKIIPVWIDEENNVFARNE